MKKDVADFVVKCLICQQVKAEHRKSTGTLQSFDVLEWKWDKITMDLVTRLPRTAKGFNSIWVIVDRLTKTAHFLPMRMKYTTAQYARLYLDRIRPMHGMPISIISNRGTQFTSRFWSCFKRRWGHS